MQNSSNVAGDIFHFLFLKKLLYFDSILAEICSKWYNICTKISRYYLDNELAPNSPLHIIWTDDGHFADAYTHHSTSIN